jgi:hypothetical protein
VESIVQQVDEAQDGGIAPAHREHVTQRRFVGFPSPLRKYAAFAPLLLVPLVQIAAILWLIWERTPDVPNADEWGIIPVIAKLHNGQINLADFWASNNGHRIVIMRVLEIVLIELTHWNRQIMMTVNLVIAIGSMLLLLACVRRTFISTRAMLLLLVPLSLLFFSLGQFEDWMLVYTNNFFTTIFAVALCMWALTRGSPSRRGMAIAICGALIATLSAFPGLAVWVVFLPVLWMVGYRKPGYYIAWVGTALLITGAYLIHLPKITAPSPIAPPDVLRYILVYLGAPMSHLDLGRAQFAGAVSIAIMVVNLVIYWLLQRDLRPIAVWLGLAAFAFACASMAAIGRGAVLGVAQAVQSRYQAFSSLWWIALLIMGSYTMRLLLRHMRRRDDGRSRSISWGIAGAHAVALIIACIALAQTNRAGFQDGRIFLTTPRANQNCVLNYDVAMDACLRSYIPFALGEKSVRIYATDLERLHLGIFYHGHPLRLQNLKHTSQSTYYSVESAGGVPTALYCTDVTVCSDLPAPAPIVIPLGSPLTVSGWAVDAGAKTPAGAVFLSLDGSTEDTEGHRVTSRQSDVLADTGVGEYSPVAQYFHNPAYVKSGFKAVAPTDKLPVGVYTMTVEFVTHDKTAYYQMPQKITIDIRPFSTFARRPETPPYSVDGIIGLERPVVDMTKTVSLSLYSSITIYGWAVDAPAGLPARAVYLSIDDTLDLAADYGMDRPDVAQSLGSPAFRKSGFAAQILIGQVPLGKHDVRLKILAADGVSYYEPPWHLAIEVTP